MRSTEEYKEYRTKTEYVFSDICHTMATHQMSTSDGVHAICEFLCSTAIQEGRSKQHLLTQVGALYDHFSKKQK